MDFEFFAASMAEICGHCLAAPGRVLRFTIITNPKAGGFVIQKRWRRHEETLKLYRAKAASLPARQAGASLCSKEKGGPAPGLILTTGPGHASKIAAALIDEIEAGEKAVTGRHPFHLIITAGGDGTSLEVLTSLFQAKPETLSHCAVLRLPMGTGNDGADAAELADALNLLVEPVRIDRARALRLRTATSKGPFLAFNILSVGLDAFVTHMTNKMKGKFPGDSYKLWVDIAALLYDRIYRVDYMDVRALDEKGTEIQNFREKVLLLAVGASGHRTYGSHNRILPDDRNVCVVKQMPLLRKIALKGLFKTGEHIRYKESILLSAACMEFRGEYPILAQMDGETVLLTKEDFPAAIELTAPIVPVLRPS
ncbi:MAG: diacylglycerol kinase [Treponema sp.]|jgi:diacylglycerol kinase family enzyme|nr:diacylglycerol kinase [Treponema sp.]